MSDTAKIIKPSEASRFPMRPHPIERKPPVSDFLPQVRDQIIYAFKRRRQEPRAIAGELTRRSGVRIRVRQVNDVLRQAIPDRPAPHTPAPVIPIRRAA